MTSSSRSRRLNVCDFLTNKPRSCAEVSLKASNIIGKEAKCMAMRNVGLIAGIDQGAQHLFDYRVSEKVSEIYVNSACSRFEEVVKELGVESVKELANEVGGALRSVALSCVFPSETLYALVEIGKPVGEVIPVKVIVDENGARYTCPSSEDLGRVIDSFQKESRDIWVKCCKRSVSTP